MPGFVIEKEVVIDAPLDVVWRTVTEPEQIAQWFADKVELDLEPGGEGYLGFGEQGGPIVITVVQAPNRFSFRWNHPAGDEPVAANSLLVEFTLTPEGSERTRLKVTESDLGLLGWPEDEKRRYSDEHRSGWGDYLGRLQALLAVRQRG